MADIVLISFEYANSFTTIITTNAFPKYFSAKQSYLGYLQTSWIAKYF